MPNIVVVVLALVGGLLIVGELAIRILVALGVAKSPDASEAQVRLDQVTGIIGAIETSDLAENGTMDEPRGTRLLTALRQIAARAGLTIPQAQINGETTPQTPWSFLDTVVRRNVFLGAGVGMLLIAAAMASGASIDFSSPAPTPTPTNT